MDSLELNALPAHPSLLHPLTGQPLRAIGHRPDGSLLWPIMGGDGTGPDANADAAPDGDPDPAGDAPDPEGEPTDEDPDGKDPRVQRANREAARYRTELRATEAKVTELQQQLEQNSGLLTKLAAVFNPEGDGDGEPDAEQVAAQIESLTSTNQQLQASLLVHELATDPTAGLNANPVALLDSRRFTDALAKIDPSADDYRDQVAAAIKDAASKNAAFRAGQGSSRGGSELDPERRERRTDRPKGLGAAIGAALNSK